MGKGNQKNPRSSAPSYPPNPLSDPERGDQTGTKSRLRPNVVLSSGPIPLAPFQSGKGERARTGTLRCRAVLSAWPLSRVKGGTGEQKGCGVERSYLPSPLSRMERGNVADLDHYKVRLNDTLASISITNMKISRNATSPLTAAKSAPLKRICLIALTE